MPNTPEWIGFFLVFFVFFCLAAFPVVIIIYIVDRYKNWRDPDRSTRNSEKELGKIAQLIRATAGILLVVLGGILFIWPVYRLLILKDIPYEPTLEGIMLLLLELFSFYGLPLTLISMGIFYLWYRKRNMSYTGKNTDGL